jgi:hypothetical protein
VSLTAAVASAVALAMTVSPAGAKSDSDDGKLYIETNRHGHSTHEPRHLRLRDVDNRRVVLRNIHWRGDFNDPPARARGKLVVKGADHAEKVRIRVQGQRHGEKNREVYRRIRVRFNNAAPDGFKKHFSERLNGRWH